MSNHSVPVMYVQISALIQKMVTFADQVLMRLHESPLVCARLTCADDLHTWLCVASFVVCARGLHSLVLFPSRAAIDDDDGPIHSRELIGINGVGAEECARVAARCLKMRGGALETVVWNEERDLWRI
jgi:hypothetical protein